MCKRVGCVSVLLVVSLVSLEGVEGLAGYGAYCAVPGSPTRFAPDVWAEPAACPVGSVQEEGRIEEDARTNGTGRMDGMRLVNLVEHPNKFCCHANYTALIDANSTVEELDAKARSYTEAATRVLRRFDCRNFYPYMNCTPCEYSYKSWVCAVLFPRACQDDPARGIVAQRQKICSSVCYEVVRKCPVELGFVCPSDNSYGDWGTPELWDPALGNFTGGCNPMQYNLNAAQGRGLSAVAVFGVVVAAVGTWL
eukprot:Hpha_TRINITY_DN3503_c0_g2::TRINITY_DN3503_c0_g2_i1::g.25607::m.25607